MSAYLAYSYSKRLNENEGAAIDKEVCRSREEFFRGFKTGTQVSILIYSLYQLTSAKPAHASPADKYPDPNQVAPKAKPGHKPLSEGTKGTFVGGASAICAAALQSGDFYLGLACAFLLIIGGIVINRPDDKS
jgi:hypothetical protein